MSGREVEQGRGKEEFTADRGGKEGAQRDRGAGMTLYDWLHNSVRIERLQATAGHLIVLASVIVVLVVAWFGVRSIAASASTSIEFAEAAEQLVSTNRSIQEELQASEMKLLEFERSAQRLGALQTNIAKFQQSLDFNANKYVAGEAEMSDERRQYVEAIEAVASSLPPGDVESPWGPWAFSEYVRSAYLQWYERLVSEDEPEFRVQLNMRMGEFVRRWPRHERLILFTRANAYHWMWRLEKANPSVRERYRTRGRRDYERVAREADQIEQIMLAKNNLAWMSLQYNLVDKATPSLGELQEAQALVAEAHELVERFPQVQGILGPATVADTVIDTAINIDEFLLLLVEPGTEESKRIQDRQSQFMEEYKAIKGTPWQRASLWQKSPYRDSEVGKARPDTED